MRAASLIFAFASPALAGDFALIPPIDCPLGEDQPCYIQHYVDRAPGPQVQDFMCGGLSYDTHKGTDFALRSHAQMTSGVNVLAAAPGTVKAVRDGMIDKVYDPATDAARVDGRDCGNGLVIDHGDGWETQYCHLRQGSVSVARGDTVAAGTPLGLVGMSGVASFPHIHLSLRKDGAVVDPYAPNADTCGPATDTLWQMPPAYQDGGLISAGFAAGVPAYDAIKAGTAHSATLPAASPALVLWGFAFGTQAGDILRLTITDASGQTVFTTDADLQRAQPQLFRAGGRKTQDAAWFQPGSYTGTVSLMRDGQVVSDLTSTVTITD